VTVTSDNKPDTDDTTEDTDAERAASRRDPDDSSTTRRTVDEEDEADDTDDAAEAPERHWRGRILGGALAAIVIASLAGCGYFGWTVWQDREATRAGEQAREAAVAYAQVLTSIDANKVDENFDQVLDGATGEFKDMYSQSSMQLRQLLIDNKATAHGVVLESAVQSQSKDRVVVLLFVDQSVTNTSMPDPRIDRSRIKMTMEHVDGGWRTSKVELP
jgi:Mce-associated membrane protein